MMEARRRAMLTELLLDDGEDLLARKLGRNALDSGQGLTSITLCLMKDMLADGPRSKRGSTKVALCRPQ